MKWMTWIPVIGFAVAVFLLTADPMLGAILPCLLAARKPIESALWLQRVDEHEPRRFANQVFLISLGCWQSAMTAFLSIMGFAFVAAFTGRDPQMDRLAATGSLFLLGLGLRSASAFAAAIYAWRHGVKVWPHPDLCRVCDGDFHALSHLPSAQHGFHYGLFVLGTALAAPTAAAGVILMVVAMQALGQESVAAVMGCLLGSAVIGIVGYGLLSDRILARSPAECWTVVPHATDADN
jgi:hypothetical protein